jgi:hypothetical protein
MARGLTVLALLAAFTAAGALAAPGGPAGAPAAATETVALRVGDRVQVEGEGIGCRVARLSHFAGRTFFDCRRAGPLAGSYGTLLGEREVSVVRFRNDRTAKVVFSARHKGAPARCG